MSVLQSCSLQRPFLNPTLRQLYSGAPTRAPSGMQPMEMVHHRINERSSSAREGCRQHEAKLQCSPKARATQHHHARATKVKAACLDSGDVRLGLSRRSPSERANCCATCRQRMDSTPTSARSDARAATGARGGGGLSGPRLSFKVGFLARGVTELPEFSFLTG